MHRSTGVRLACVLLPLLGSTPLPAPAADAAGTGREPVLKQIRRPASTTTTGRCTCPQLTSGPSAPTWSPDGSELAVSMQGALWRQAIRDPARPAAHGRPRLRLPARLVARRCASWPTRATATTPYELRALELASGKSLALTAERRRQRRSTLVARRDAHRLRLDGVRGALPRVQARRERRGPRHDRAAHRGPRQRPGTLLLQRLRPRTSRRAGRPTGRSSSSSRTTAASAGTGGLWRMNAEPGAPSARSCDEETTWQARPDWSRDGKRVVYASYLGRQWHQLWLVDRRGRR